MARTPAYWTNKKCRPSLQAVSQLSPSHVPHGFGAPYRGFPTFLSPSNKNRQATQAKVTRDVLYSKAMPLATAQDQMLVNNSILRKFFKYGNVTFPCSEI